MASTLIINPGSSSKKYSLFCDGRLTISVRYERQDDLIEVCTITSDGSRQKCEFVSEAIYKQSLVDMLKRATAHQALTQTKDIIAVGVRVVVPGSEFQKHQVITPAFISRLRERSPAAPLHIPPLLYELEQAMIELPNIPIVGVSDSAFHRTMSKASRRYTLPEKDSEELDIKRFGYHGISLSSVVRELPRVIGDKSRVIICHVGSGISITAVENHASIDTSMGYSPLSGLVMGTRAGDLDQGALLELMRAKQFSVSDMYRYLSLEGGLKGITGQADLRIILERAHGGDADAELGLSLLTTRFQKQLLAMMVSLKGTDAIVFTGTAAERNGALRARLVADLAWVGVTLDATRNEELAGGNGVISGADAPIMVAVVKTREEIEMLRAVQCFS